MKQNRFFFKATTNVELLSSYQILASSAKKDLKLQQHWHAQIGDGSFVSLSCYPNRWCLTPSQPLQRTKQCCKSRRKNLMDLALAQLSISTSIYISRNKRCQKGQIWAITMYQLCGASRNYLKFWKSYLHLSILAILECAHLVFFEKQVNTRHVQLHTQTQGLLKLRGKEQPLLCPSSPGEVAQALPVPSLPCFLNATQSTSDISLARAGCHHAHQSWHWTLQIHVNMDFRVTIVSPSLQREGIPHPPPMRSPLHLISIWLTLH